MSPVIVVISVVQILLIKFSTAFVGWVSLDVLDDRFFDNYLFDDLLFHDFLFHKNLFLLGLGIWCLPLQVGYNFVEGLNLQVKSFDFLRLLSDDPLVFGAAYLLDDLLGDYFLDRNLDFSDDLLDHLSVLVNNFLENRLRCLFQSLVII